MLQTAKKVIEVITDLLLFCSAEQLFDFLTSYITPKWSDSYLSQLTCLDKNPIDGCI